jgi:hypothetical protein
MTITLSFVIFVSQPTRQVWLQIPIYVSIVGPREWHLCCSATAEADLITLSVWHHPVSPVSRFLDLWIWRLTYLCQNDYQ